ncbi:G2/mitotic-specific cyclin-B [Verticillium alfalfae VaMs.102]|uniref:G2/mitotic-specific cyclin-B n=1 Tax=Verticillium alfalfae (strain VaMs.102 / ATCC MYA-4576 / FGSC 10136) TaxID=526221 RepID=C9SJY3_VERA1|nr:G2/mitotic-specific cyclin-B [Verticillium alfalfae VaMs.102]EEY19001.1 G2/mitotic-specific cyclin-B [Verticillium alfalfae VaMs.102]
MPPARSVRTQRLVSNENDENSGSTRMTRAKAAAQGIDEPKKVLQTKKSALTVNAQGIQRKRGALEDVSNVGKISNVEGKKAASKGSLVSKVAQPTGIQKQHSRATSTRPVHGTKDLKKPDAKRSGSGSIAAVPKRKVPSTTGSSLKEATPVDDGEPALKKRVRAEDRVELVDASAPTVDVEPGAAAEPSLPAGVKDLDSEDLDDPLMVAEYANEIFEYLRDLECKSVVQLDRLQLVGVTAMFIAAKYEEVMSPHVGNFRKIADDGFTEGEILSAEQFLLSTLNYDLSYPNPMNFLRRISKADNYDIQCRTIGKYLTEISLLDHRFLAYRPSHVAAGAMYLARMILDRGEWDETIAYYAGYTEEEVEPVAHLMVDYLARPVVHEAFFKKYASKKFLKASILTRSWAKRMAAHFGITDTHLSLDQISTREDDSHYGQY